MDIKLPTIEILVATMYRTSLDFLWEIFKFNDHFEFNILIINQTTPDKYLKSNFDHIRVINMYEFGVPKSRNLAINKSTSDICLMADDDIVYQPNLKQTIEVAYINNPNAVMISFEAIDEQGKPYTNYFPAGLHNKKSLKKIYTWVISFRRLNYKKNKIYYNIHFGFGATFKGCEEYVFLRNAFDKGLKMIHVANTIVQHPNYNSGRLMGSDNALFAKTALRQRFYGNLSYLWLIKYVIYIWRHNYINFKQIPNKIRIGLKGINAYKSLTRSGEIDKIYGD